MNIQRAIPLAVLALFALQDLATAKTTAEELEVKYFLDHPDPADLPHAQNAIYRAPDPDAIRKLLRAEFQKRWIAGSGQSTLTLQQFDAMAEQQFRSSKQPCAPFGADYGLLVDLLAGSAPPAAWHRTDFRDYVRARLPIQTGGRATADRLVNPVPANPEQAVARLAFLIDVLPPEKVQQVRDAYAPTILKTSPAQMAEYHRALLGLPGGFTRFRPRDEAAYIRRELGDRLLNLPSATWSQAGDALPALVSASRSPVADFFEKAADYFREHPADRGPSAGVLALLADLMGDPGEAFRLLKPSQDAGWFAWLHTAPVLLKLHGDSKLLARSYEILRDFASRDFPTMFPGTVMYYYGKSAYTDRVFADLLRPQANGPQPVAVLRATLERDRDRTFRADHRETLASDVLVGRDAQHYDPLGPAWQGANSPTRLDFALQVYVHLLEISPSVPRAILDSHLGRPLLDEIVTAFLDLLRRPSPATDSILRMMAPLASHLEDCHRAGGDTASAAPLLRLEREISDDMTRAIAAIVDTGGDAQLRAVDQFVERLTLALRIRILVTRALGRPPIWLATVRQTLRQRVFAIADASGHRTLYWSPDITRWRAGILDRIDGHLRELLRETGGDDEGQFWFEEVYLPLIRVHGFLKVLRERNPSGYPHLLWVRSADTQRKGMRLKQVFEALQTDRWLDAEDAVTDFAREHWESLRYPGGIWALPPDLFFAGSWGVNANVRIYRRFLNTPPPAGGNWQTPAIAAKVVDELAAGRMPVGPVFPSDPGNADLQESLWPYARWAGNLVTTAEWQRSPFIGKAGPLRWQELVSLSNLAETPFRFTLPASELSRRVDGQLRLRLARALVDRVASVENQMKDLDTLANIAVLLPNNADNLAPGASEAVGRSTRFAVYAHLSAAFSSASSLHDKELTARDMMRLYVATRSGEKPEPSLDSILQKLADAGAQGKEAAADIDAERLALIAILNGKGEDNINTARTYIDGQIGALLPKGWNEANANIIAAQFTDILKNRLSDDRVRAFLQLRRRMQIVADTLVGETSRPADFVADMERIERSLELVNSHVWYTRRAFNPNLYFMRAGDGPGAWWPALVVLAWPDQAVQLRLMDALAAYHGRTDAQFEEVRGAALRQLLQLNEAIFATMTALAERPDAAQILANRHTIPWSMLNLRLLAETENSEEASPSALAVNCFSGLLTSYSIASMSHSPSDEAVWQKLFGSFDYLLPTEQRRSRSLTVNLDKAVALADDWAHSGKVPIPLRDAAIAFASASEARSKDLLAGAATPAGVMRTFNGILDHLAANREKTGYVSFYTNAFTSNGQTLSPNLTSALADPFFRGALPAQMNAIDGLLQGWQQRTRSGPATSALDGAYRGGFDRVLAGLVRGQGRPPDAPWIWRPVQQLREEQGLKPEKPVEFLKVAAWLLDLEKRYPVPNLRALFAHGGRS